MNIIADFLRSHDRRPIGTILYLRAFRLLAAVARSEGKQKFESRKNSINHEMWQAEMRL